MVRWPFRRTPGSIERGSLGEIMDIYWLIGAIIGSGVFIFAGRAPAQKLIAVAARRQNKSRPRNGGTGQGPWG